MNIALKSVLLSALVYPGAGHFFLKKYRACIVFVVVFSVPLFSVINDIVDRADQVVELIIKGEVSPDIASISESLSSLSNDSNVQALNFQIYIMLIVWVIGIYDAYRQSKLER